MNEVATINASGTPALQDAPAPDALPHSTEAEQQLAAGFGIQSIPTLMAFRDGVLVFNQPGALPPAQLEQLITAVNDLDMDQVRAEIAAADAAQGSNQQES